MNYNHAYHAGNFADVFKHLVLMALFAHFKEKETPFAYIDTHAGYPYYDLTSPQSLKTGEAQEGIQKLYTVPQPFLSTELRDYLQLITQFNAALSAEVRYYPGSSAFAAMLKRKNDALILNELAQHPYGELQLFFRKETMIRCYHQDAYHLLKAVLPPKERRGFVLIDPPYDSPHESYMISEALQAAVKSWSRGTYVVWYPVKEKQRVNKLLRLLTQSIKLPHQNFIFSPWPTDVGQRFSGSGMLIFNPPWKIEEKINALITALSGIYDDES